MDKNDGNPQQKEGFELDEQQQEEQHQQDQNDSTIWHPAPDFLSIAGMDSSELAEEFLKLKVEMKKKDAEMMALKQENDKLKGENEALKAGTSPVCLESSTESAIASDFTPEMNTRKRPVKRFINWLHDSLPWIGRTEMANSSLSTSCELFRQLCWPKLHQNVKPYKIRYLDFIKAQHFGNRAQLRRNLKEGEEPDGCEYYEDKYMAIPIASIPPPDYIVGFESLYFSFVNDQVVNFAENIAHLLQNCKLVLCLDTPFITWKMDKKRVASTCALLKCLADKIFKIEFRNKVRNEDKEATLDDFNQLFPGILDHVQSNGGQVQDSTRIIIELD